VALPTRINHLRQCGADGRRSTALCRGGDEVSTEHSVFAPVDCRHGLSQRRLLYLAMIIWLLLFLLALRGLCLIARVFGIRVMMVLALGGWGVFVLLVAREIYSQYGGVGGALAAVLFTLVVGLCLINDLAKV
jgi:hypothetical protein